MPRTSSSSPAAAAATDLVEGLQRRFAAGLTALAGEPLRTAEWLRDDGRHGGGHRYFAVETSVFHRVAINVSHVHYDDDPSRPLGSATALSTIIHPDHPRAPSVHIHISWTERKDGAGGWRVMADLNPAIPDPAATARFADGLRAAAPGVYEAARVEGDRYFEIPALGRHRGVTHFYLESYATADAEADRALARAIGEAAIDGYLELLADALAGAEPPSAAERATQLAYHTVYAFQVLTLDRGTTSGLLVHDQNDLGILGSLPAFVDRELLGSWRERVPEGQRPLLDAIVDALAPGSPCHVDEPARARLAVALREFYRARPEALELQASGSVVPPTVGNHAPGEVGR